MNNVRILSRNEYTIRYRKNNYIFSGILRINYTNLKIMEAQRINSNNLEPGFWMGVAIIILILILRNCNPSVGG